MHLDELCDLTIRERGTFTLTIRDGQCRATFKVPRVKREVVRDNVERYPSHRVGRILEELLVRLGYRGVPTLDRIIAEFTAAELERLKEIIGEARTIRSRALDRLQIERVEPRLASPRSSLGKEWTMEADDDRVELPRGE